MLTYSHATHKVHFYRNSTALTSTTNILFDTTNLADIVGSITNIGYYAVDASFLDASLRDFRFYKVALRWVQAQSRFPQRLPSEQAH